MLKEERQQQILDHLYADGNVNVNDLANRFRISKDTIRRDLTELEDQGILRRVYGGAVPEKKPVLAIERRKSVEKNEKYLVARKAASVVRPDSLIAVDGGTTNILFASLLPVSIKLRVVTNSFPVAEELRKRPGVDVFFVGGRYSKGSQTTVGETVFWQLREFYFDQCFLGVYGVDAKQGASVPYPYEDEAAVKKFLVENSAEVNLMCSCSKLDKISNYIICPIEEADRIICEHPVIGKVQARYQNKIY